MKCPNCMTNFTLIFLGWALKSLYVSCISTVGTSILVLMCTLGSQITSCVGFALGNFHCHVAFDLLALALQMTFSSCICLLATSVCWCLRRLICMQPGRSPATCLMWYTVALELSILLARWHTLLVGNLSKCIPPSLMALDTNSSSLKKNQKMSL